MTSEAANVPEGDRLFEHYCHFSHKYWPQRAQRQARKIEKKIRGIAQKSGHPRRDVPALVAATARRRLGNRRRTVHLANIGSSGSHWLESMLVQGADLLGAGEVYLPSTIERKVRSLDHMEAAVFMDALNILHAGGVIEDESVAVIHSLHSARPEIFLQAEPATLRVLLLRDPVDVCLSRSFRKSEYRQDVAPDVGDMAYLEQNISKVREFLTTARGQTFDLVLRYEDLLVDPVPGLASICELSGTPIDYGRLEATAREQSARNLATHGGGRTTNLFMGEAHPVPQVARERATTALADLSSHFGYARDNG